MVVDSGRGWALRILGEDGVSVRERIPSIIRNCHDKMANAQAEAEMKHSGVYGQIWHKCLEDFVTELGGLPSAEVVHRRGYRLVSFNGTVLFPWRFARDGSVDVTSRRFAVSDTRISLFTEKRTAVQQLLDIEFGHPELSQEELALLESEGRNLEEILSAHPRVVIVFFSSNPSALHGIDWGEAKLGSGGYLTFSWMESLLDIGVRSLVDVGSAENEAFSDGPIPRPLLGVKDEEIGGVEHE